LKKNNILFVVIVVLNFFSCFSNSRSLACSVDNFSLDSIKGKANDNRRELYEMRSFPQLVVHQEELFDGDPLIITELDITDSIEEQRERAHSLRDAVEKAQRYRESLDASTITDLPIGVVKSGGEALNYSIVIDRINFTNKGSELTAYMSFVIPENGKHIAFGGKIPLSKEGGIVGTPRIYLLGDHIVTIGSTLVTLKGSFNSKTFVEIDCSGFKGMSIEAQLEFSRDQLIPEDEKGNRMDNERVKINFQTYVQDWNELLVKISMPAFQVKGLDGVGFKVDDAYLDWSDLTNPSGLIFPKDYESSLIASGNKNLWKGFFLKKAEVRLPNKFQEKQNGVRTKIGVENLIIDDTGFSGQAFAENLIRDGDMSGWSYSIDIVRIGFVSNQLQQFQLGGKITVPVLQQEGKPAKMGFFASRGIDGNYIFAISVQNKVNLPLWAADITLYNGTAISVVEKNEKFYPMATLNGMFSIKTLSNGPKSELTGIRFEQLIINSEAPFFRGGTFGFGTDQEGSKASGFPLVIKNIGIKSNTSDNRVGLSLDVTINIGGDPSNEGFSGTAGLIVWGKMSEPIATAEKSTSQSTNNEWQFDQVELTAVGISIKKPNVYDLTGFVRFFQSDPNYGDGFKGQFTGKLQKIDVAAVGLFGKTDTYRYWFADALVEIKSGVVLAPGLAAYGFGGGFYSHMKQSTDSQNTIGVAPSGITYVPDENSLGLRAFLSFGGTPSRQAFNGDVTLQIAMNKSGGINSVNLDGNAYFLTPSLEINTNDLKDGAARIANKTKQLLNVLSPRGQVYGTVSILFDNVNDVFHGSIEVYANAAGGLVKGIGPGDKAGWAVVHFANDEWYVLIGTPDQPIGLEIARLFKSQSYFMMGKNLPGSPPPHPKVQELLHINNTDYMRDFNALQSGTGFAFGLNFGVDTGDLRFLMFYGRFSAGAGFDIMLKNYNGYHCEGSNEPMGINGWYANGQAYAYVEGKIGIKVNLKFYKGDYDILTIGAAALLQVKGPNPFWMKGTVGGNYRILGGLVKGSCKFEVTIGKECKPVGESNPLQDVNIIAEVSPVKGSTDIDVFNAPQAAFNVPIGEIFEITDIENRTKIFRVKLNEFSIKDGSSLLEASLRWNASNDVAILDSRDILPQQKELKASVRVQFEERVGVSWQTVIFDGKPVEELVETIFTTGKAPDFIPPSNVSVSYPVAGQYNFYPREYAKGFIKLKKGQPELFLPGTEWTQKARSTIINDPEQYKEFDFSYDAASTSVNFNIPVDIPLNSIQRFELLNIPRQNKVIDANVQKVSVELISSDMGAAQLTTKNIEGELDLLEVKALYQSEFRTSMYGTFKEKMDQLSPDQTSRVNLGENVFQLASYINGPELFDDLEVNGNGSIKSLITAEARLSDNDWYINYVYPLVYADYPIQGFFKLKSRTNPDSLGIPPSKDVFLNLQFNGLSIVNGQPSIDPSTGFAYSTLRYNVMVPMKVDYLDIQHQVVDYKTRTGYSNKRMNDLILLPFPIVKYGQYKVNLQYTIPGINKVSSGVQWQLFNIVLDK
jgi:hypothetical protein